MQRRRLCAPARDAAGHTRAKTSHTLNPVPLVLYDTQSGGRLRLEQLDGAGLANVAATTVELLGFEAPAPWRPSLLRLRE